MQLTEDEGETKEENEGNDDDQNEPRELPTHEVSPLRHPLLKPHASNRSFLPLNRQDGQIERRAEPTTIHESCGSETASTASIWSAHQKVSNEVDRPHRQLG